LVDLPILHELYLSRKRTHEMKKLLLVQKWVNYSII
jgi:hypothetical protein